ncbi:uncharacterized protein B0H18DRAFT_987492 [Fomitopsis serialis]|uniref:uncharacterized protein n=1 Tax=Fomitopsis serialis TaxID=139415 RepID=UPI002007E4FB|nr:uncharacterized protein B0H18DRAFT_987492 [Neoantrodia serialis]KAH9932302.1 hypothetical protein B0H18DRAFT_987492 [Neoantrodia serialis]
MQPLYTGAVSSPGAPIILLQHPPKLQQLPHPTITMTLDAYAPSEKGPHNHPPIGAGYGEVPPPYTGVDDHSARYGSPPNASYRSDRGPPADDFLREEAYAANEPWTKDASMPYEGRQSYESTRGFHQPYAGQPPSGMPSQPYADYAGTSGAGNQLHSPYASQPGASYQTRSDYAIPPAGMNYASPGYAPTSGYSDRNQMYESLYPSSRLGLGRLSPRMTPRELLYTRDVGIRSSPAGLRGRGVISGALVSSLGPDQGVGALLDPPPPSFRRPARPDLSYEPFEPASVKSLDKDLDRGFPLVAPPSRVAPHPFATHDVFEDDWQRFLHDVKLASSLTSNSAQMGRRVGIVGALVSMGVDQMTKSRKSTAVAELIDQWNASFFHPRQMTVVLAKGSTTYSGPDGASPPDMGTYEVYQEQNKWRLVIAYHRRF